MRQALSGLTVLEVSDNVAGGYCAKLFGDLGAEVWRVEGPAGDGLRRRGEGHSRRPDSFARGGALLHLGTNKLSVIVDPTVPASLDQVGRLVGRAHLVVYASDTVDRELAALLDWCALHDQYPQLSVVRISGFGQTGPYAAYRWSDLVVEAMSGVLLRQDTPGSRPLRLPGELGSCFVGNMAALAGLAAVTLAEATGVGSYVDCAAVEALATTPAKATTLLAHHYRGGAPAVIRSTTVDGTLIPTGVFPCSDGYMAMMSTPQQLAEMLEVLDDDNLREAFAQPDAFERGETKEAVDAALYPWLLSHTRAECTEAAQKAGWPLAGVYAPEEVLEFDHLHQRNFWVHADDPESGSVNLPGPPWKFAEGGWALHRLAPGLGEQGHLVDASGVSDAPGARTTPARPASDHQDRATESKASFRPPLEGIRVVDLTTVWSGPYATMLLADLGAEVIRVENPWVLPPTTKGYSARPNLSNPGYLGSLYAPPAPGKPDRPWNRHAMNNSLARNKLSCTMDTRRPEGRELLMQLVERADVFIENFKASGLERIGISVCELQKRNPDLVVVRMPPTGLTGDWSHYTGFGAQFDGLTGLLWLCGEPEEDLTMNPATVYMDAASGPAAAFAALAGLRYREVTGRGQLIEFTQSENVLNHLGDVLVDCQLGVPAQKMGNRDRWRAPQGVYACREGEGWLALSVADDEQWEALSKQTGIDQLVLDGRFATLEGRRAHHDEIDDLISSWTRSRGAYEAFHTLQCAGVAAAPVLDDARFVADPHVGEREWLQPLQSGDVGTHRHPGHPYRGIPQVWRRGSPVLGEDNEYVFTTILGVSADQFERYRQEKIIADDYLDSRGIPY